MPASSRRIVLSGLALIVLALLSARGEITRSEAERIGQRIWRNECGGTIAGLTSWNEGENFASLGIGHFIWYPAGERGPFEESFPPMLKFLSARGAKLPGFIASTDQPCPWHSRIEFEHAQDSMRMKQLRQFLASTVDLQAQFLVARLQDSLPKMLAQTSDREAVQRHFDQLAASPQGCYALVDYVNFKGEGTLASERYRGQGWGLLQVLENMRNSETPLDEFATSAKNVLRHRVANSPPGRGEERWLRGWLARVETYRR